LICIHSPSTLIDFNLDSIYFFLVLRIWWKVNWTDVKTLMKTGNRSCFHMFSGILFYNTLREHLEITILSAYDLGVYCGVQHAFTQGQRPSHSSAETRQVVSRSAPRVVALPIEMRSRQVLGESTIISDEHFAIAVRYDRLSRWKIRNIL